MSQCGNSFLGVAARTRPKLLLEHDLFGKAWDVSGCDALARAKPLEKQWICRVTELHWQV
jgi:hypothetical protein